MAIPRGTSQRSPISIDAVQAVQVSIAPYSVINNGFLGGQVNVVTRSGTNITTSTPEVDPSPCWRAMRRVGHHRPFPHRRAGSTVVSVPTFAFPW